MQEAHRLAVGVLLDHGEVGVQADAHGGVEGNLEGGAVVLGADHGPQLLAVHRLLHLLEEAPERLPVAVRLELQANVTKLHSVGCGWSNQQRCKGELLRVHC